MLGINTNFKMKFLSRNVCSSLLSLFLVTQTWFLVSANKKVGSKSQSSSSDTRLNGRQILSDKLSPKKEPSEWTYKIRKKLNLLSAHEVIANTHRLGIDGSIPHEKLGAGSNKQSFEVHNSSSCRFWKATKELLCRGSLDLSYLLLMRHEQIEYLIVDNYIDDSSSSFPETTSQTDFLLPKWYLKFPSTYPKITGRLQLKDTIFQIDFMLNMKPSKNIFNQYSISGEAFSTKFIKISSNLNGSLIFKIVKNQFVIFIDLETTDSITNKWVLQSNLTLDREISGYQNDDWFIRGVVKSDCIPQTQEGFFMGMITHVNTKIMWQKYQFSGKVGLQNANLLWGIEGKLSWRDKKQITIPKAAFSAMKVKNLIFRNSDFFNDFDEDAFEGLEGVETLSFLNSKLAAMPKLSRLFRGFTKLKEIYIEDCTTPRLVFGSEAEASLKAVQKVSYMGTGPLNFGNFSFSWLKNSNVTYLNLRNSHIVLANASYSVLGGVAHSLKYLDISHSSLKNESDMVAVLKGLKIVNLTAEGLELKQIPKVALNALKNTLRYLSLRGSNFDKAIGKDIFNTIFKFPFMPHLIELDLSECQINYMEIGVFDFLPNLKVLNLANNNLENLQDGWFYGRPQITHLDLGSNKLSQQDQTLDTILNLEKFDKLEVLNLSNGIFKNPQKLIRSLGPKLRVLFMRNTNLENLTGDMFDKLTGIEVLDINSKNNINGANIFLMNLIGNLKNLKVLNLQECRINTVSMYELSNETNAFLMKNRNEDFPILENLEVLDLSYNNFKTIDSVMFRFFPNLRILKLSGNGITTWKNGAFDFSERLEGVYLNENKIEYITTDMKSDLMKLKFFKLGNNPFLCGSYVYDFIRIAEKTTGGTSGMKFRNDSGNLNSTDTNGVEAETIILDWSDSNYVCFSKSKNKFVPFISVEESFEDVEENLMRETTWNVYMWILLAIIFGVVFTVGILCKRILDIHLITKIVRNAVALSFISRKSKEPEKYNYNVFISYSDKDRQWVIDKLIPRLQSNNDIKVCLHERDFQVGLSILENIIASIDSSSNIMLILSTAFLKSHWCQYEMHLAQHRLLENGRDQLILILLEDIPQIKRPKILRYLMMTKTYLEWPVNSKNQNDIELFWSRLLKSLKL